MSNWLIVYTMDDCKWCDKLKDLLRVYGFDYYEKNIIENDNWKEEFLKAGHRTVPQLYIEGVLIGGYEISKLHLRNTFFNKREEILLQLEAYE